MRKPALLLGAAAGALVITNARATVPGDQYATFGEGDIVIQDAFTNLVWERKPTSGAVTEAQAAMYCQQLTLAGYNDWRLPTYKELLTLVDEQIETDFTGLPKAYSWAAFPYPVNVNLRYWSSTPVGLSVWTVRFDTGDGEPDNPASPDYVRCVRTGP
jgi:hypothetical protein